MSEIMTAEQIERLKSDAKFGSMMLDLIQSNCDPDIRDCDNQTDAFIRQWENMRARAMEAEADRERLTAELSRLRALETLCKEYSDAERKRYLLEVEIVESGDSADMRAMSNRFIEISGEENGKLQAILAHIRQESTDG